MRLLTFILLIISLSFSYHAIGQNKDSILLVQQNIKYLKGIYNATSKNKFYYKNIDENNMSIEHQYTVDKFYDNIGVIKYEYIYNGNRQSVLTFYGIVDTLGNIVVSCIFDNLQIIQENKQLFSDTKEIKDRHYANNLDYFIFKKNDSIGIVGVENEIIFKIPLVVSETDKLNIHKHKNYIVPCIDTTSTIVNYCKFFHDTGLGLFSLSKKKIITNPKYKDFEIYGDYAVGKKQNGYNVINCITGKESQTTDKVFFLNMQGVFLVQINGGGLFITSDIFTLDNDNYELFAIDSVIEYHNFHIIVQSGNRIGVINTKGEVVIPFIYDDIYFLEDNFLMLKQNGLWAISTYNHQFLSDFDFLDIDKQNAVNYTNFLYFCDNDTVFSNYSISKEVIALKQQLHTMSKRLSKMLNSHILSNYGDYHFKKYILKKNDGFHLLSFFYKDSIVQIDSIWWDDIFLIPVDISVYGLSPKIGVRRGNKYGYYTKNIEIKKILKYDGIRYIPSYFRFEHKSRSFSNGSRIISNDPYTVIKRGEIYYYYNSYVPFSNGKFERNKLRKRR